jgi:hypothetical protein
MVRINTVAEVVLIPKKVIVDYRFLKAVLENIRTYLK